MLIYRLGKDINNFIKKIFTIRKKCKFCTRGIHLLEQATEMPELLTWENFYQRGEILHL